MDEKGLGKRLQAARQNAGMTQQQLCSVANLSFSTLTKIERGAIKAPSIFTIQAISAALNIGLDDLIGVKAPAGPERVAQKTKGGASFIYFDVNGCLVHFFQGAFTKLSLEVGIAPDVVETAFWHYNDEACRGHITAEEFNQAFSERLGLDQSINWKDYYMDSLQPIQQMHDSIKYAAEHYKIGLLTNIMPGFLSALRQTGLVPDLNYDAVVDSSQVGAIKPEAEIFKIATEEAGVSGGEILFIDDSRPNLMAAEKFGWHVIWYDGARPDDMADRIKTALEPAA